MYAANWHGQQVKKYIFILTVLPIEFNNALECIIYYALKGVHCHSTPVFVF